MKNLSKISFVMVGALWLLNQSAYAALDLELTRGTRVPIPVAVMNFASDSDAQINTNIGDVVHADLQNSGRFLVANNQTFNQSPSDLAGVDFNYWRQFRLNAMVVGKVQSLGKDQYQVTFTLVNLFQNQAHPAAPTQSATAPVSGAPNEVPSQPVVQSQTAPVAPVAPVATAAAADSSNPVLAMQTFTISSNGLRNVAHQISNIVYQTLTGEPGIFTTKIAYVMTTQAADKQSTQYALQVADYDGYQAKTLYSSADPIMSPSWSPNGQQLAFVAFDNKGYPAVYAASVTTGQRRILSSATGLNAAPVWSPDGQQLALVLSKNGSPKIYLLNAASKQLTQLTTGFAADTEPAWYPDGNSLAFTSNRSGTPQIYQMNLATQAITQLSTAGTYNTDPAISADGKTLLMLHGESGAYNIAMQDLSSGQTSLLTDNGLVSSATFAPNSDLVMYATYNKGHSILAVTAIDESTNYALPVSATSDLKEPAWGPIPSMPNQQMSN